MPYRRIAVLVVVASSQAGSLACGGTRADAVSSDAGPAAADGASSSSGASCVIDSECAGEICAQIGAGSSCAPTCTADTDCASGAHCRPVTTVAGDPARVCVGGDAPTGDARDAGAPRPVDFDGGAPVQGTVGANGGSVDRLYFGVVGDTRPPFIDDTKGYPVATIDAIYARLASLSPSPPFVVSTGDYIFANPFGSQAAAQFPLYLAARAKYAGALFPALGNHECLGNESSNCGPGSVAGTPNNYAEFMNRMLTPIGKSDPWYSVRVDALDHSWTAKVVVVAANAWNQTQAYWLEQTLSVPTTYTFVVRHEPRAATKAPGTTPSETIMAKHPYTLAIVGHTHLHERSHPREVIFGNGGAPLTQGQSTYGFGMLQRRADGAIQVDAIDVATGSADATFRFAVNADGSDASP